MQVTRNVITTWNQFTITNNDNNHEYAILQKIDQLSKEHGYSITKTFYQGNFMLSTSFIVWNWEITTERNSLKIFEKVCNSSMGLHDWFWIGNSFWNVTLQDSMWCWHNMPTIPSSWIKINDKDTIIINIFNLKCQF